MIRYWRTFRQQRHPWRFLAMQLLWRSRLCRLFEFSYQGARLRFHPSSLSAYLWLDPSDRADDCQLLRACLRPGDVMVDVGANIGSLTLVGASAVGAGGTVLAIEPHPRVFSYLVDNVRRNEARNVVTRQVAVADHPCRLRLTDRRDDDVNAVSDGEEGVAVDSMTLDELTAGLPRIRLLKIDVEGYERRVLQGGKATLTRTDLVYCEACESQLARFGDSLVGLQEALHEAGFSTWSLAGRRLTRVSDRLPSKRCENWLAVRDSLDLRTHVSGSLEIDEPWAMTARGDTFFAGLSRSWTDGYAGSEADARGGQARIQGSL